MPVVPKQLMSGTQTRLLYASSTGLEVSPGYLLQDSIIQRKISHQLFQPGVLLLKFLETLRLLDSHPTIFLAPAIVGLLCDAYLFACWPIVEPRLTRSSTSLSLLIICSGGYPFFGISPLF